MTDPGCHVASARAELQPNERLKDMNGYAYVFAWPPYGGAVPVYKDGDKYWFYTNCWVKYLEKEGNGFLEYEPGNPPKPIMRYKHDDEGRTSEETYRTVYLVWGTNFKMNGEEAGRYYMTKETPKIPGQ